MKNSKVLIMTGVGGVLLLTVVLNIQRINKVLAEDMLSVYEKLIHNASLIGFRSGEVDSLYNDKSYRYMLFVRELPIENEVALSVLKDSVLIVRNNKVLDWNISLDSDTVALPESLFNYAVADGENATLYAIESVKQDTPNHYKMRRIQLP